MVLRQPRPTEYARLDDLYLRSKAVWGYDQEFLKACAPALRICSERAECGDVIVAETGDLIQGVAQIVVDEPSFQADLDLLFVEPAALGIGVGRQLFGWACQRARRLGASSLVILSDPSARGFYERQGAQFLGLVPSDVIAGRRLPLLSIPL